MPLAKKNSGATISQEPPATQREANDQYDAAVENWLGEPPASANAALALVEFAGILAADRLIGDVLQEPVAERDAYHQALALLWTARALLALSGWLAGLARKLATLKP